MQFQFSSKSVTLFFLYSLHVVLGYLSEQRGGALHPPQALLYCSIDETS